MKIINATELRRNVARREGHLVVKQFDSETQEDLLKTRFLSGRLYEQTALLWEIDSMTGLKVLPLERILEEIDLMQVVAHSYSNEEFLDVLKEHFRKVFSEME